MSQSPGALFERLLEIMAQLRDSGGCPWDREQTRTSLKAYLLEEAYEVLEAIEANEPSAMEEELGDLLFQVVFHARIAEERGAFDLAGRGGERQTRATSSAALAPPTPPSARAGPTRDAGAACPARTSRGTSP